MGGKNRVATPPDGGWGWAIVLASFMIHVVADGVAYTFGLFFEDITRELKTSYSAAAWVASIMAGMTYSAGPVASAFVNRFGCRAVSIAGSIVAAFGFAISYYANSVVQLYFSAGLLGGLGLGLIYLPAIVMVTCYFEKKRAFATGIAVCGSGFGTFLFAPLIKKLLVLLDWRLAFVATGGIILTCLIFSLLFRPIKIVDGDEEDKTEAILPANEAHSQQRPPGIPNIVEPPTDYNDFDGKGSSSPKYLYRHPDGGAYVSSMVSIDSPGKPAPQMLDVKQNETLTMSSSQPALPVGIGSIESLNRYASLQNKKRHSLKIPSLLASDLAERTDARHRYKSNRYSTIFPAGPILERKDVFYSGSLIKIPDFATLQEEKSSLDSTDAPPMEDDERPPDFVAQKQICGCIRCSPRFYNVLTTMLRVSLLKDPVFVLFAVSNFLTSIGYNVPYIYLVGMAERNVNQSGGALQTELLLSIIGIANTVSRIVLGYLSDKKWVNRLFLYNFALTGCGIATIAAAHATTMLALQIYSAVFGALVGVYVSLTSVILVDLLGLDKLTNAFGLLMLFQGVGTVIGPPIVGLLVDEYKDYKLGFALAGGMIAFSGIILFIIPLIHKRQRRAGLIKNPDCRKHLNPQDLQEGKNILTNNNKTEIFSKSHEKLGERV